MSDERLGTVDRGMAFVGLSRNASQECFSSLTQGRHFC